MKKKIFAKPLVHKTIEKHLQIIPNRYELARVTCLRTRELLAGSPIGPNVDPALLDEYRGMPLPYSRAYKVALDEILKGDVKIQRPDVRNMPKLEPIGQDLF